MTRDSSQQPGVGPGAAGRKEKEEASGTRVEGRGRWMMGEEGKKKKKKREEEEEEGKRGGEREGTTKEAWLRSKAHSTALRRKAQGERGKGGAGGGASNLGCEEGGWVTRHRLGEGGSPARAPTCCVLWSAMQQQS